MRTPQWRYPATLIRRLADQPQQFQFFQAVRIIDVWLRRDGNAHGYTLDSVLRCKNSVSLRFPASEIEQLSIASREPLDTDSAWQNALARQQLRHIHLTPAFMGLLGVNGVLPYCYTDTVAAQIHFDKNEAGRAFLDCYTHRSMTLFYRAWEKCRVEFRRDAAGRDEFLGMQLALAAAPTPAPRSATVPEADDDRLADEVLAHYATLIRQRPVSGDAIVGVLNEYFGVPFQLEPFVGAWVDHPPAQQSQLDVNCRLGQNTLLGARYWRRDLCARLRIGPLCSADTHHFLEHGGGGKALKAMLALFAPPNLRFEVRVILRAQDVRPARLNADMTLARDTFLTGSPSLVDRDDIRYYLDF